MAKKAVISAVLWPNRKKIYFFKGKNYIHYDINKDQVDSGYPKKIKDNGNSEFNVEGAFKLMLVKISEASDEMPNNWDNSLKKFCSNRSEVVHEIEKWSSASVKS